MAKAETQARYRARKDVRQVSFELSPADVERLDAVAGSRRLAVLTLLDHWEATEQPPTEETGLTVGALLESLQLLREATDGEDIAQDLDVVLGVLEGREEGQSIDALVASIRAGEPSTRRGRKKKGRGAAKLSPGSKALIKAIAGEGGTLDEVRDLVDDLLTDKDTVFAAVEKALADDESTSRPSLSPKTFELLEAIREQGGTLDEVAALVDDLQDDREATLAFIEQELGS